MTPKLLIYAPILLLLLLLAALTNTFAQFRFSSLSFGTNYLPASRYIRPEDSVKTISNSVQVQLWMDVGITLFNRIDTGTGRVQILTSSLRGHYTTFSHKLYEKDVFPEQLLATDLGLQYFQTLRNKWSYMAFASVGINSDLNRLSGNDVFAIGGIIFIKSFRPNFSMGFGLIAHNSFGKVLPWPALMVRWQMGTRYKLQVNVPENGIGLAYNVGVSYATSKTHNLTLAFRPRQISYDVEHNPEYHRLGSYWELPIGLESRWQMERFGLFAGGGLMALRSFAYGEKNISRMFAKYPAHQFAANLFLNAGIQVRF